MLKQLRILLSLLFLLCIQMIAAGPAPEQPGMNNPEFGRGGRDRDRWTWCRCRVDRRWDDRGDDRGRGDDNRGGRREL